MDTSFGQIELIEEKLLTHVYITKHLTKLRCTTSHDKKQFDDTSVSLINILKKTMQRNRPYFSIIPDASDSTVHPYRSTEIHLPAHHAYPELEQK